MLTGVNVAATRAIAEVSGLKITASGGVASLDDVYAVKELEEYGVDSLIIGKALYEGIFTLEEALDAADDYDEE
jgi:phosphoribosylformimino-5-aminoimidazole carboxamide ribonucleotide (ProFAR) isomerase